MANEWNLSYPIDHTLISALPAEIRKLKTSAKAQLGHEHETPVDGDATGSEHSSGSAVAYEGSSTPTTRPGGATLGDNAIDRGKLWLDDNFDPPVLKRWDGSAWEIPMTLSFGTRTNKDSENNTLVRTEVYKAGSDGFLTVRDNYTDGTTDTMELFTDSSNPPTTLLAESYDTDGNTKQTYTIPIRKDDYWKVVFDHSSPSIYWLPIGAGTCVKQ